MGRTLSVIVPIYNAEKYLSRCLDSLLDQDVGDYEIICVNDGSTDSSSTILADYGKRFPNVIRIVEQQNQGLPAARNVGMEVSQGEVIAFCDVDDYLIPGAYGYVMNNFWRADVQLLRFDSLTLDKYVLKSWKETNDVEGKLCYEGTAWDFIRERHPGLGFVWNNLYRRSFLEKNRIQFRPVKQCEDEAFNLDVYIHNPFMMYVSSNLYRYTVSPEQITRIREKKFMRLSVEGYLTLFRNMIIYAKDYPELDSSLTLYRRDIFIPCMSRVLSACYSNKEFQSLRRNLREIEMYPIDGKGKLSWVINFIMHNYMTYFMASAVFRYLFVPYVLPQLRRN